jgi:cardiolipin synthase
MNITANQVTLLRLILLPIPCVLLFGGPWHQSLALFFFILVGLTDYWDGYLARKQGPTTLGALIDPMADKIYITAMFIPLARIEVVPIWMVLLLFVREYTVTELRSVHGSGGVRFHTSELAKYKTTIQMIGVGVIIMNEIFQSHWSVFIPYSLLLLFTIGLALWTLNRHGSLGPRTITFMSLVAWTFAMRILFSGSVTNLAIMSLIVAVTLISGFQYILHTRRHLTEYVRSHFGVEEWASFIGIGLAFPIIYVSMLYAKEIAVWMVIVILSVEFATGGLNNFLTTSRSSSRYRPETAKILLLITPGLAGLMLFVLSVPDRTWILNALLLFVLLTSLLFCVRAFYRNRHALCRTA